MVGSPFGGYLPFKIMPKLPRHTVNEYDPDREARAKEAREKAELKRAFADHLKQRERVREGERILQEANQRLRESSERHREWQKKFERENYRDGKPIKRPKKK